MPKWLIMTIGVLVASILGVILLKLVWKMFLVLVVFGGLGLLGVWIWDEKISSKVGGKKILF